MFFSSVNISNIFCICAKRSCLLAYIARSSSERVIMYSSSLIVSPALVVVFSSNNASTSAWVRAAPTTSCTPAWFISNLVTVYVVVPSRYVVQETLYSPSLPLITSLPVFTTTFESFPLLASCTMLPSSSFTSFLSVS